MPQNPGANKLLRHNPLFDVREVGLRYPMILNMKLRTESRCNHLRCILPKLSKLIPYTRVTLNALSIKLDNR